jgi:hypothetical protein
MLASLLRPRKSRQPVVHSASPHETTPFFRSFLREDGSLAPTEPDDYLDGNDDRLPLYGGEETEPHDDDSDEGHLLPIFSSPHLGEQSTNWTTIRENTDVSGVQTLFPSTLLRTPYDPSLCHDAKRV